MSADLIQSIVRILTPAGATVGTGFVASDEGLIATCSHVVQSEASQRRRDPRPDHVDVIFLTTGERQRADVVPEWWRPYHGNADLAILRLEGDLPTGVKPLILSETSHSKGHSFETFGFPEGGPADGMIGAGEILGAITIQGIDALQLRSPEVTPGFSGAPVWDKDTQRVIGMVSTITPPDGFDRLAATAFAIPAEVLAAVCPALTLAPVLANLHGAIPSPPRHFIPRPEYMDPLKAAVLSRDDQMLAVTGATRKVGVQGMGGIGKSVLAASLARDEDVRRVFPDGVIWLTLGQGPNIVTRQEDLARALGGEPETFTDTQRGKARLRELLPDKACLVILDDVWQFRHATAFDVLAPNSHSCLLFTTRDAGLVRDLGAQEHCLDLLTDEQALALLAQWAGVADPEDLPPEAQEVVRECGNLPLALAMIGALVQHRPEKWESALHRLRSADLEKIRQQFPDYAYPDLLRAIQVSIDALAPAVKERYFDFAVFPEDTPVPQAVLETFWAPVGLDTYDVQDTLDVLVDRSLARRDDAGALVLHDLQQDHVRRQVSEENLLTLHGRLLDAYAACCANGWPSGPDDRYFFQHLPHHLVQAERVEELHSLLLDFHWLQAKLDAAGVNALLADYDLALAISSSDVLHLLQGAIRLSAHILAQASTQLAGQLWGRLRTSDGEMIKRLLTQAQQWSKAPWLRPLHPTLPSPDRALLLTLRGHNGHINRVRVTADGRYAISASQDQTITVWNLELGKKEYTLSAHNGAVNDIAVTRNGRWLVSVSNDHTVKVWDLAGRLEAYSLSSHLERVVCVDVTPDGRWAISGARDNTIKLWNLATRAEEYSFDDPTNYIMAIAISADGQWAVSGYGDGILQIWNLSTKKLERTLARAPAGKAFFNINSVALPSNNRWAVSVDWELVIWDMQNGNMLASSSGGHTDRIGDMDLTADDLHAITCSNDGTLRFWNLATGRIERVINRPGVEFYKVAATRGGEIAISYGGGGMQVWDLSVDESEV